jgi:hypothetical protein
LASLDEAALCSEEGPEGTSGGHAGAETDPRVQVCCRFFGTREDSESSTRFDGWKLYTWTTPKSFWHKCGSSRITVGLEGKSWDSLE